MEILYLIFYMLFIKIINYYKDIVKFNRYWLCLCFCWFLFIFFILYLKFENDFVCGYLMGLY